MALDMFMKLTGEDDKTVAGESKDKTHNGEIAVLAWSWGVSNSGSAHEGTGAGSGKCNVQDLSFTKYVDIATPELMLACCNGKHYKEALLTVRKAGEKPVEYLKITLTDLIVTSLSTGGSGGEDRLTENVSLNFGKVKLEYTPQNKDGTAGTLKSATYDIVAGDKES